MLAELHPRLPTLIGRTADWMGRRRVASAVVAASAITILSRFLGRELGAHEVLAKSHLIRDLHDINKLSVSGALTWVRAARTDNPIAYRC